MRARGTLSGNKIGKYAIEHVLGEGSMGIVYLARHEVLEHEVALKILRRDVSLKPKVVQRFFLEAKAVAQLRDPGLAQMHDFGHTDDGRAYIVMEYLNGENLQARMQRETLLSETVALRLMGHVARTLAVVHAKGIVHRDLKPDNLFIVKDDSVDGGERTKILDFGVAKLSAIAKEEAELTLASELLGTPLYMAPEQWQGAAKVDTRADIYSFGCILYRALCGSPPFTGDSLAQICTAHLATPPKPLRERRQKISPALDALVLRCLEKQPDQRPESMQRLSREIDALLSKVPQRNPSQRSPSQRNPSQRNPSQRNPSQRSPSTTSKRARMLRRQSRTVPVDEPTSPRTPRKAPPRTVIGMARPKLPAPPSSGPASSTAPRSRKTKHGTLRMATPSAVRSARPNTATPQTEPQHSTADEATGHRQANAGGIDLMNVALDSEGELPTQKLDDVSGALSSFLRDQFQAQHGPAQPDTAPTSGNAPSSRRGHAGPPSQNASPNALASGAHQALSQSSPDIPTQELPDISSALSSGAYQALSQSSPDLPTQELPDISALTSGAYQALTQSSPDIPTQELPNNALASGAYQALSQSSPDIPTQELPDRGALNAYISGPHAALGQLQTHQQPPAHQQPPLTPATSAAANRRIMVIAIAVAILFVVALAIGIALRMAMSP